MAKRTTPKIDLYVIGQTVGLPTFDDIVELTPRLTSREPTPDEIAEARAEYEKIRDAATPIPQA